MVTGRVANGKKMKTNSPQNHTQQKPRPHLWIMALTLLALAIAYPFEAYISRRAPDSTAASKPTFSLPEGHYDRSIRIRILLPHSSAGEQNDVIFTVDGRAPTHTVGETYKRPIHLSATEPDVTVIRARAILPEGELGPIASASYFVGISTTLPMMSLIVEPDDLWDPERGIYANQQERGRNWERRAEIVYADYVDQEHTVGFHIPAGIRLHGGASREYAKKSLRLYFRSQYGAGQLEYPLFKYPPLENGEEDNAKVQSFERLVLHNGGQDWHAPFQENWTLLRNQLADRLALQIGGYAPRDQPVLLFINGEPWGIYQVREHLDGRFLADHYGVQIADLLNSPEHVKEQDVLMGDREHWDHLLQFVESHDLADPANYAYVESQVDTANFIDYTILQIYIANFDWPNHNVRQFRPRVQGGRWHWILWDSERAFGAEPHRGADLNMVKRTLNYNHPQTGGRDALLLRKLLENPTFSHRFIKRSEELLATTLSPRSVTDHIDALAAQLRPNITYETAYWADSTDWAANVQELHDFALRRPDFVRRHLTEYLNQLQF